MSLTVKTAPRITAAEAARIALEHYDIPGEATPLPSERDQNFRIGSQYVLKLANSAEHREVLDFQNAAFAHLSAWGIECPQFVEPHTAPPHCARLFTWIDGEVLATIAPQTRDLLASLGTKLAEIDRALADFHPPALHQAMHRTLHWDIRHAALARQHLRLIPEPRRAMVEAIFAQHAALDWDTLRHSVIHGDANDYNVLVRDGKVVTILDLGDSVHTATVCDLAIAVAYAMLDKPDPLATARIIIDAYHLGYPLTPAERAAVLPLAMTRLAMSVCYSAFNAQAAPDDAYQQVSAAPAWRLIERMAPVDLQHVPQPDNATQLLERRHRALGPSLSISYAHPLHIVHGWRQFLYDPNWRPYLDCVNNVAHVGHSHPGVARAIAGQSAKLNTNTRYLHELLVDYAERLAATLPDPLSVVYFVCSGSEANELALRMARAHTQRNDIVVLDTAYHGNTSTLVDISPYKYEGPGGHGRPGWVRQVPYVGAHHAIAAAQGLSDDLRRTADAGRRAPEPQPAAAFIHESALGCAGQVFFEPGYLAYAYEGVRRAGAVCIADEVQTGFGRAGTHFWMFETQGVTPDIVTMGKPIGNGHPIGAVVTTREIAASFANGMEYFNTFGGNPVSCAAGLAVLEAIREEGLQENARTVGDYFLAGLRDLSTRIPSIADARGQGLFLGIELARDGAPAADLASEAVNRMKEMGVLLSTDGPHHNVIKIKPPMCFTREDADTVIDGLRLVL